MCVSCGSTKRVGLGRGDAMARINLDRLVDRLISLRSRRQHKAWGASPGTNQEEILSLAKAGNSVNASARVEYFICS